MVYVNLTEAGDGGAPLADPGIYPVRIRSCKEKHSKSSGDPMFSVEIEDSDTGQKLCYVNIMLAGKGFGLGKCALVALGIDDGFEGDLIPSTLVGRKAWVALKHEDYQGSPSVKVDTKQGKGGWWPFDSKHETIIAVREKRDNTDPLGGDSSVPF